MVVGLVQESGIGGQESADTHHSPAHHSVPSKFLSFASRHAKLLAASSPLLGCLSLIAMAKRKRSAGASASRGGSVALKTAPRKRSHVKRPSIDSPSPSIYSVHPGIAMVQKWVAELNEKTGRTLDQWIKHIQHAGPPDAKDCRD